jgi:hypothetical protein
MMVSNSLVLWSVDADGPVHLELPNQWLWDIIDEFIYQVSVVLLPDNMKSLYTPQQGMYTGFTWFVCRH